MSQEELKHYGVLGMKWGVRRGRTTKAYEKASKKVEKNQKKYEKLERKAQKRLLKVEDAVGNRRKTGKATAKFYKAQHKANKQARKAKKWLNAMEKTFANTDIKLSERQVNLGKQYAEDMKRRSNSIYNAVLNMAMDDSLR